MKGHWVNIAAADGGQIPTYLSLPRTGAIGPAVAVVPSIFGVKEDMIAYADDLAANGFCAAIPNPFWRDEDPQEMPVSPDGRARAFARMGRIDRDVNIADLGDVIAHVQGLDCCNGKAALVGFCMGGQFALLAPKRLGLDAGIAFHSSKVSPYLEEVADLAVPIRFHWGDADSAAPMAEEIAPVQAAFAKMADAEVAIYPGIVHGFMQWTNEAAYDKAAATASWQACLETLARLR